MHTEADEVLMQKEGGAEEEKERMKGRRGGGGWDAEIKKKARADPVTRQKLLCVPPRLS